MTARFASNLAVLVLGAFPTPARAVPFTRAQRQSQVPVAPWPS